MTVAWLAFDASDDPVGRLADADDEQVLDAGLRQELVADVGSAAAGVGAATPDRAWWA